MKLAARDIERLGRTAGRLFAISTAGSIAGTFATSFWLVPEYGTDQVLAVGALVLLVAAAAVALLERLWLPGAGLVAAAGAAVFAVGALAPDTTGRVLSGSAARNWSPLYREREVRTPRKLDPAEVGLGGEGFTVREARDTRYHRLLVVEDGTLPLPPLRQLVPERDVPRSSRSRRGSRTATTSSSGSRTTRARRRSSSSGSAARRCRSGSGATSATSR